nr:hypothetical protein [uncultured Carboxylicivirga sp.]
MEAILIFIIAIVGLNCIPLLIKKQIPKLEKIISRILILTTITSLIFTTLLFIDYRLKGIYSNSIIGLTFIFSCLLFFSIVKYSRKKILKVILLLPLIIVSIYTLLFGETLYEYRINDTYKIETFIGGFLACGENIKMTKSEFGILERSIYRDNNICLKGIYKIESLELNENHLELLIYHDGEMDSENPYSYEIKNKNVW